MKPCSATLFLLWQLLVNKTVSISLDLSNISSIYEAQNILVKGSLDYYNGNKSGETPGMFTWPYYWWEAGVAWGTMVSWSYYSGNHTYDDLVRDVMVFQAGDDFSFMPNNQTSTEGNDDQGFWGVAVMDAAEKNFSQPLGSYKPWAYMAQAVFNTMAHRWDTSSCGGGLRWQIFTWNSGYNYKNSVSNGCLFNLAARLARYTTNATYIDWAEKVWDWELSTKFIDALSPESTIQDLAVYDGATTTGNCSTVIHLEWTYNQGLFMSGCAYLYNYTGDAKWLTRLNSLWGRATVFFNSTNKIMYEAACQPGHTCTFDERCFKAIFARFLGTTQLMAPEMVPKISPYLNATAMGAAQSCSGGTDGVTCGLNWFANGWDGFYGLGEEISALDVMNSLLIHTKPPPYTAADTGYGNYSEAGSSTSTSTEVKKLTIGNKDRAGAGIITAVVGLCIAAATFWLIK